MTNEEILSEFRAAEALLEGHFILSSGLRSPRYLQCARVLMDPRRAERLVRALADRLDSALRDLVEVVVSPAMGGVIVGHEMGRALGVPAMFVERPEGVFGLRRGFRLEPGQKVLLVEDVVTTGLSSREAIAAVTAAGGTVIAAAALAETFELRHVTGRMHTLQLGNRGQPRCAELDGVAQSGRFDARQRRTQSPRAFGVPLGCRVLVEFGVRKDDDGRCHAPTLETPTLRPTDVTPVPGGARS